MKNYFLGIFIIPFVALTVVTQLYILLPVSKNILDFAQGATKNNIGWLTTIFGIFYSIGLIFWGSLSDKIGRERILLSGLVILACITFTIPLFEKKYVYLVIIRAFQGFFSATFPPVAIAWISINLNQTLKSVSISIISCAFLLAGTIGQWIGQFMIINSFNESMNLLSSIYISAAGIFYFYGFTKKITQNTVEPISVRLIICQLTDIFFDKNLFKIYLCALFVLMSFVSLSVVLLQILPTITITALRNLAMIAMLCSLTTGYLFKIVKPLYVLAIVLILMSLSLSIHALYLFHNMTINITLYVVHFLFIMSIAFAIPSMITCVTTFSDIKIRGVAISLYTCILFIGASLGALLPIYLNGVSLIYLISGCLLVCSIQLMVFRHNG